MSTINLFAKGNKLDSSDFDPITFLNDIFPNEKSLLQTTTINNNSNSNNKTTINQFVNDVNELVKVLDNDISTAIQKQAEEGDQG